MLQPGQQIENYRIDSVLGEGGMGSIYRATDVNLMRPVAVKVMHGNLAADPTFQARFLQEARAAARLDHPSIVRVYHFGRQSALLYIVMELIEGLSLGAYLRQLAQLNQVVRLEETLTLVAQAADALGYAHRQGVVLYQLATGKLPLDIRSPERAMQAHQYETVAAPRELNAGVPPAVEAVILRALNRRPENRYQSAEELATELRRAAGTVTNQQAQAFAADTGSLVVSMVTEFPTPARRLEWDMRPRRLRDQGVCRVLLKRCV